MRLFKVNTKSTSYVPPVIKAAVSLSVIAALLLLRFNLFRSQNQMIDTLIGTAVAAIVVLAVLRIYISIAEIIAVHDNTNRISDKRYKEFSLDDVIALIEKNDIIELLISDSEIRKTGASSKSKRGNSGLYDKRYYIDGFEFSDIVSFKNELNGIFENRSVKVISIDGLDPNIYNV